MLVYFGKITYVIKRKVVSLMTLAPVNSLKASLHFPNRDGNCFFCNEEITFVNGLNRYVGNDGIRCTKVGA